MVGVPSQNSGPKENGWAHLSKMRPVRYFFAELAIAFLASVISLSGQAIIENQAKPLAPNPGRVIALERIWTVTDESGQFYFQAPGSPQIADDGTIYLADMGQILKFAADGKFIKSLCRKGEGPGEIQDYTVFRLKGKELIICTPAKWRLWRADLDGVFKEDIKLESQNLGAFIEALPDGFVFRDTAWPPKEQRTGKLMDAKQILLRVGLDGKKQGEIYTFPFRYFMAPNAMRSWDSEILVLGPEAKTLIAYHGQDYLIELLDIGQKKIVTRFRRPYSKVPHVERQWEKDFAKRFPAAPKIEFESDVQDLYLAGDHLWVQTSTKDEKRGSLFDVFSPEGRWLDSFYLGAERILLGVWKDFVFVTEKNPDDTITLVKYGIAEKKS